MCAPVVARADDNKPRVMVILDTSRSMTEMPKFVQPKDIDITFPMSTVGGDYNSKTSATCLSKFCTAKEVLYNTIPSYVDAHNAHIGLSTYFQYVLKATRPGTEATACSYDVLARPGELREFRSYLDFTGSGTTTCPGGPSDPGCAAVTRAMSFPDGWSRGGSGAHLDDFCATPQGYSRPADLISPVPTCSGADCYLMTKTNATPRAPLTCTVWSAYPITLPHVYSSETSQCGSANYRTLSSSSVVSNIQIAVSPEATTCPGAPVPQSRTPTASPTVTYTSMPRHCEPTAAAGCIRNAGALECTSGAPCALYLESHTPTKTNAARSWYGLFRDPVVAAPSYTGGNSYTFGARTSSISYVPDLLTGAVSLATGAACLPTGRYSSGTTDGTFGIVNASNTLDASPVSRGASAHETPTRNDDDFECTAEWPCDVTLVRDTPVAPVWRPAGAAYNISTLPTQTMRVVSGPTTNVYTARVITPSVTSCAALGSGNPTPQPSGTIWTTAAPTGCGADELACTFSPGTPGTVAAGGACPSVVSYVARVPPNCPFNGKAYALDSTSVVTSITKTVPATSSCTTGTFTINEADEYVGVGGYPASISFVSEAAGTPQYSASAVDKNNVPSGYSGVPEIEEDRGPTTLGADTASTTNVCADSGGGLGSGASGGEIESSDSRLCAGSTPCTLVIKGMKQTSSSGCGSEGRLPCHACEYQPKNYRWARQTHLCTYSATRSTYAVDQTAMTCSYARREWEIETLDPPQHICEYSMGARRYDFNQPADALCSYWALRSNVQAPRDLYTYQYHTKGTEIIGRAVKNGISANLCSTEWTPINSFGQTCPEMVSGCAGMTAVTDTLTQGGGLSGGMTCRLQYGGSRNNRFWIGTPIGRYSNFKTFPEHFDPISTVVSRACEASAPPANPDHFKNHNPSDDSVPVGFCSSEGRPPQSSYSLVSDWYDPNLTNSISVYDVLYPPATYTKSWTNTPAKTQGASVAGGTATVPTGALLPRSVFVPIATNFDGSQGNALRAALDKCIPPSVDGAHSDGSLKGGACVSDTFNPSAEGYVDPTHAAWKDMTPLYGSLKSTQSYLLDRWTNDDHNYGGCRDYYIVLATDGLESTPKGYTLTGSDPNTSVEGLVRSFRNLDTATSRTRPDIKTFVIGFGEGAAGSGGLSSVADAGGTGTAYSATSRAELVAALNAVFTTITQGTFSRSKPALGTDGTRLYAAQYVRPAFGGPDWSGLLTAYKISALDGSLSVAWELSQKLDDKTAQAKRSIAIGLRTDPADPSKKDVLPFSASLPEVNSQLSSREDYRAHGALTTSALVDFLVEKGHLYSDGKTTRKSAVAPIINSNPIVLSRSPYDIDYGGLPGREGEAARRAFSSFVASTASRGTSVLFEGTDGMVHSIVEGSTEPNCLIRGEADPTCPNGTEAWAFIPGSLRLGTQPLSNPRPTLAQSLFTLYTGDWKANLLNNALSVADVCADASWNAEACSQGDWHTIAIGTQREGGRGMFAIDITRGAKPEPSAFLWDFSDGDLGYTYSVPAIGRVRDDNHDRFVAVFGGGKDDPRTAPREGRAVWVIDALTGLPITGLPIAKFDSFRRGSEEARIEDEAIARPAIYRRPGSPYLDSAYVPIGPAVYALRFNNPDGTFNSVTGEWKPDEFFNPSSLRNTEVATCPTIPCGAAPVRRVVTTPGTTTKPPTYALELVQTLPIQGAPSILNRPKVSPQLVPSGAQADLFVGTGDTTDPAAPSSEFMGNNYFYALHDFNEQKHEARNDGRALWVVQFPAPDSMPEEIVSEPAFVNGCVVVATYHPPTTGGCSLGGDATLYGFDPVDGSLKECFTYSSTSPYAGASTSVLKFLGGGIPSDLVAVNDDLYFMLSNDGVTHTRTPKMLRAGKVRSYRRLK